MIQAAWTLFLVASLIVIATPGQDIVLVMSRSISRGMAAGVATAAGVSVGLIGHTVLATLGLGAVLRASEWLFMALKLLGAGYLIWLGIGMLRSGSTGLDVAPGAQRSLGRLFLDGAFSNLANPKIAVFYLAFLPQFVPPNASHPMWSVFVLGLTFAALTFVVKAAVAVFAGLLSSQIRARPAVLGGVYRLSGAVLLGLGLRLAFERRP